MYHKHNFVKEKVVEGAVLSFLTDEDDAPDANKVVVEGITGELIKYLQDYSDKDLGQLVANALKLAADLCVNT